MARGLNKVMAIGNLGHDPETKYMPSGAALTTFSIAVSESWKDKQTGEQKEHTEWIRCECWNKLAEICAEYLRKGSQVYIEGQMRTDSYEKEGIKMYSTKVRLDNMQMLGGKRDNEGGGQQRRQPPPQPAPKGKDDFDDDIPF